MPSHKLWSATALLCFNTVGLFIALNFLAALLLPLLPRQKKPRPPTRTEANAVYPGKSDNEIRRLQKESWDRRYIYEAFTQFKEGPTQGRYVNVSRAGFRAGPGAPPWPPDPDAVNIFVFGGSTTFGYGVADGETIPAALGRSLEERGCADAKVYNLARSNYFSSQERALFSELLVEGLIPRLAVFIDGLNEFQFSDGQPKYSRRLRYLMNEEGPQLTLRTLRALPLLQIIGRVIPEPPDREPNPGQLSETAERVLERWNTNRVLIESAANRFGISTLFVWQPVPVFNYDLENHLFLNEAAEGLPAADLVKHGYALQTASNIWLHEPGLLWLGDMQAGLEQPIYVDRVHYTAAFNEMIAARLADRVFTAVCGA